MHSRYYFAKPGWHQRFYIFVSNDANSLILSGHITCTIRSWNAAKLVMVRITCDLWSITKPIPRITSWSGTGYWVRKMHQAPTPEAHPVVLLAPTQAILSCAFQDRRLDSHSQRKNTNYEGVLFTPQKVKKASFKRQTTTFRVLGCQMWVLLFQH